MLWKRLAIVGLLAALMGSTVGLYATATKTTTWGITGHRSAADWQLGRYVQPAGVMRKLVIAIDSNADGSTTTDSNLVGTLYRIAFYADGNAPSYDVNVTDADGVVIFADTATDSAKDPCGFALTQKNSAGTHYAGIPFAGAMTVKWANLDDGPGCTTENLHVILYYREEWQ